MNLTPLGLGGGGPILPAPLCCAHAIDLPAGLPRRHLQASRAVAQGPTHGSAPGLGFNALKLILKLNNCYKLNCATPLICCTPNLLYLKM